MNPMAFMKITPLLKAFKENHPKFPLFFAAAAQTADVDSIIEIKLTTSEGKTMITNMRINEQDMELFRELGNAASKGGKE